MVQRGEGLET